MKTLLKYSIHQELIITEQNYEIHISDAFNLGIDIDETESDDPETYYDVLRYCSKNQTITEADKIIYRRLKIEKVLKKLESDLFIYKE